MRRKLVRHGEATLMLSLPAKWLHNNNLNKGDEIEVLEKFGGLFLKKQDNQEGKPKEITLEINAENQADIRILLTHSYRKGFDKIIIKGNLEDLTKKISQIVSDVLLGFEIVKRSNNEIIIENVSQPDEKKYSTMLLKVFMIISEMPDLILADKKEKILLEELDETKDQCDKFILFCRKIITENKAEVNPITEWEFLTLLTQIHHAYYYLAKYAAENKIKLSKELSNMLLESKSYFLLLQKSYLEKDIESINKINLLKNKYQFGKCLELLSKTKNKESIIASYLREIFRLIQIATSPLLAEQLEKSYSK